MLKNDLSALFLLKGWMDYNLLGTDISFGDGQELIRIW